jgi:ribosome-binding factor A
METIRQQKIARLLQKEVGEIFNKSEVELIKGTMITVTQARVSPDLSIAKIYLSLFPTENKQEAIESIRKQASEVRYVLGKKVGKQLRHIPELHFYLDDSFDYAEKIDELLK